MDILVRSGDSLWYFSQIFSLPLQLLIDANRSITPKQLQKGMKVSIPGYVLSAYEIQPGDSLWGIAKSLGMPLDRLILVNQSINPKTLQVGHSIQVPKRILE